jgi:hypothetical protein
VHLPGDNPYPAQALGQQIAAHVRDLMRYACAGKFSGLGCLLADAFRGGIFATRVTGQLSGILPIILPAHRSAGRQD